jgi:hypothetical protein
MIAQGRKPAAALLLAALANGCTCLLLHKLRSVKDLGLGPALSKRTTNRPNCSCFVLI